MRGRDIVVKISRICVSAGVQACHGFISILVQSVGYVRQLPDLPDKIDILHSAAMAIPTDRDV